MSISLACPTCGHQYRLAEKLAGKTLRCKFCQGVIQAPTTTSANASPATSSDPRMGTTNSVAQVTLHPDSAPPLGHAPAGADSGSAPTRSQPATAQQPAVNSGAAGPTGHRILAGRICYFLAVLGWLMGVLLAGGAFVVRGHPAALRGTPTVAEATATWIGMAILGVLALVISTICFLCGRKIQKGGNAFVIVALVFAFPGGLWSLAGVLASSFTVVTKADDLSSGLIGVVIYGIALATISQLIYSLFQVLREPRHAPR